MSGVALRLGARRRRRINEPPPDDILLLTVIGLLALPCQVALIYGLGIWSAWIPLAGDVVLLHGLLLFLHGWFTAESMSDYVDRDLARRVMNSVSVGVITIKVGVAVQLVELAVRLITGSL